MRTKRWFTVGEGAVAHGDQYVTHNSSLLTKQERESIPTIHYQVLETSRFRAKRQYRELVKDPELMEAWLKLGPAYVMILYAPSYTLPLFLSAP